MGDEMAVEKFGSSWPLIHSESFPSDADSGYEPSPAFTSVQASFEWPTAGEDDATASTSADCPSAPNETRSAAIPIPRRRQQEPRWSNSNDDMVVDVATQTSLPLAASALPPDLVPRIEEQRVPTQRLRWVLAGMQLRRISDDFARGVDGHRRRSFPPALRPALLRFD